MSSLQDKVFKAMKETGLSNPMSITDQLRSQYGESYGHSDRINLAKRVKRIMQSDDGRAITKSQVDKGLNLNAMIGRLPPKNDNVIDVDNESSSVDKDSDVEIQRARTLLGTQRTPEGTVESLKKSFAKKRRKSGHVLDGHFGVMEGGVAESEEPMFTPVRSEKTFKDVAGMDAVLNQVLETVGYPLTHPEMFALLGVEPPRGVLLHGPSGCGKTLLAQAVAGELDVPLFRVAAPELVKGVSGESEGALRGLFSAADSNAPCIVFLDEIDSVAERRDGAAKAMERRIVSQLLTSLDALSERPLRPDGSPPPPVLVLAATTRPDALDPALRRAGRFDREIAIGMPDEPARLAILRMLLAPIRLSGDVDFTRIAHMTPGYVGADLAALTKEAAALAIHRAFSTHIGDFASDPHTMAQHLLNTTTTTTTTSTTTTSTTTTNINVTMKDLELGTLRVQPASKREGFAAIPDVTWADVGALQDIREELAMTVIEPVHRPELFRSVGLETPAGVLLYGPPGCGKTLLARCVANECRFNFISVKGPELLNMYVGESERAVRTLFSRAATSRPCIVFFDEIDALAPRREGSSHEASNRLVNQLLTELDGLTAREAVYVIAATNRPDIIDPAVLRPGRLDKLIYVPLPPPADREQILRTLSRRTPLAPDVDLHAIAHDPRADRFSGADLSSLLREASVAALRQTLANPTPVSATTVSAANFDMAFSRVSPSVTLRESRRYDQLRAQFSSSDE